MIRLHLLISGALLFSACQSKSAAPAAALPAVTAAASAAAVPPPIPAGTKMKCPVTGEDFTVSARSPQLVYQGKRYAFCCADCIPEFNKNPEKFASK